MRSYVRAEEGKAVNGKCSHWMDGFEPQAKEFEFYDGSSDELSEVREAQKGRIEIWASKSTCPQSAEQRRREERERLSVWRLIREPFK